MKKLILQSNSAKKTQKIGEKIARSLQGGEVIFLSGILGAGKTELIRGIANGLKIKSKITSPTFNIFRTYDFVLPRSRNRIPACRTGRYPVPTGGKLYHFDCYRLRNYSDLVELGWEEILRDKKSIVVLEWPECIADRNITKIRTKKTLKIDIGLKDDNRVITLLNGIISK